MKRTITALLLAAGVFGVSVAPGPAQARDGGEKGRSERSGLTLEFWGGLTRLSPRDLNRQADYDLAYVGYFFRRKFDFLRTWRGGSYSYVQTAASLINFPPISGAAPVGFRVRLNLDRVWSLSLGLDFLSRTATTYYSAAYAITDLDPDNVEFNGSYRQLIDFPQWRLAVRGWTPTAAASWRCPSCGRAATASPRHARCKPHCRTGRSAAPAHNKDSCAHASRCTATGCRLPARS